ncbi:MAG TPA: hypothetical protein VJ720_05655, partial [Chitinophaga sp.]|nr:hypothetical protein [Chitinophaga sp.]
MALLKGVHEIPLPDTPNYICPTYIFDYGPEIITTVKVEGEEPLLLNNIIKANLGKGKIIIFGSSEYFNVPMLKNPNIRNILSNTVLWGSGKKAVKIQLWERSDALQQFFKEQRFQIVPDAKDRPDPSVNILFLTKDVTDSIKMKEIEMFVRGGGTLIFGSPLAGMFNADPQHIPSLQLNELFAKAGVYHSFSPFPQTKASALNDSIPYYLHIKTILKELPDNDIYPNKTIRETVISTIGLAAYFGDTALTNGVKKALGYNEDDPVVPSEERPVYKDSVRYFLKYTLQNLLFARKMEKEPGAYYVAPAGKVFPGEVSPSASRVSGVVTIPVKTGAE